MDSKKKNANLKKVMQKNASTKKTGEANFTYKGFQDFSLQVKIMYEPVIL